MPLLPAVAMQCGRRTGAEFRAPLTLPLAVRRRKLLLRTDRPGREVRACFRISTRSGVGQRPRFEIPPPAAQQSRRRSRFLRSRPHLRTDPAQLDRRLLVGQQLVLKDDFGQARVLVPPLQPRARMSAATYSQSPLSTLPTFTTMSSSRGPGAASRAGRKGLPARGIGAVEKRSRCKPPRRTPPSLAGQRNFHTGLDAHQQHAIVAARNHSLRTLYVSWAGMKQHDRSGERWSRT